MSSRRLRYEEMEERKILGKLCGYIVEMYIHIKKDRIKGHCSLAQCDCVHSRKMTPGNLGEYDFDKCPVRLKFEAVWIEEARRQKKNYE